MTRGFDTYQFKMTVRLTFFATISLKILITESVLPPYVPALHCGQRSRDSLVEQYFNLGFGYTEILAFLCIVHGIQLSVRHLKRILARKGLRRRGDQSDPVEVISAVEKEFTCKFFFVVSPKSLRQFLYASPFFSLSFSL